MAPRKQRCRFCRQNIDIDYKNTELLSGFINSRGKILPRAVTGNCALHQRVIAREVKKARNLAFLPFVR